MARDVHSRYLKCCEKKGVEPLRCVVEALSAGSSSLSLAGNCISVDACKVLAKTLQHGHPFTHLDLSDCLIGDEGLCKLVEFLRDDIQITSVILKGNSIRTKGALALSDLLKRNSTIEMLGLEWNSIGLQDSSMQAVCEGLAINTSLRCLDLRSNHVNHTSVTHLAAVILINVSLEEIDLRWNNLGVLGGRKLLNALKSNVGLRRMRMEGNSIPSDITEAIEMNLSTRVSHQMQEAQRQAETLHLSAQLSQLHSDSKHRMMEILDTLDSERTAFLQTTQLSQCEIADLKAHLEERDVTNARLETKLLEEQSALRHSLSETQEMSARLEAAREQAKAESETANHKIEQLLKEVIDITEKAKKDAAEAKARERAAETKIHSLELAVQLEENKLSAATRDWETLHDSLKSRISTLEAQLSVKEAKHKEQVSQLQHSHQKEMLLKDEEHSAREEALTSRAKESRELAEKLEKELRGVTAGGAEERRKAAEELEGLQQALKLQTIKTGHLEDQIKELKTCHNSRVDALHSNISHEQEEKERLEGECSALQKKLRIAHQELEREKSENESSRESQRGAMKQLTEERDTLAKQIKSLRLAADEEREQHKERERRWEGEVQELKGEQSTLKQKLEQQRAVIQRFKLDEQQRILQLKTALNTYFTSTPKLSEPDL